MATRYRHVTSGAVVSVRDDKAMDADWKVESDEKPAQRRTAKKAAAKQSSDDE